MTKSRKKNYKLRRSVKRTVASITMVMAVVVAAIPVENYGTMQASGIADGDMIDKAEDYIANCSKLYDADKYENAYTGEVKTVQFIEGDTFTDAYKIKLKSPGSNEAIMKRRVFGADIDRIDIHETEY